MNLLPAVQQPNNTTVLYHGHCPDGFCAAFMMHCRLPEAGYLACHYDVPVHIEDLTGRHVILVDFSLPRQQLLDLRAKAASLVVLDHHKTAEADLAGLDFCRFDQQCSGAVMAFQEIRQYLAPGTPFTKLEMLSNYVQDRDLWTWRLPDSRAVSAGLDLWPRDFAQWAWEIAVDRNADALMNRLIQNGTMVLQRDLIVQGRIAEHVRFGIFCGVRAAVINTSVFVSEMTDRFGEEVDVVVSWHQQQNGTFRYSLRTRGNSMVDASDLAQRFGGGGHAHAAGFVTDQMVPFVPDR
jgi:oligoribonuclease NrnB/cAMP/cGMP phosphodiesterase (DHH superfamily)